MNSLFHARRTLLKLGMFAPLFGCAGAGAAPKLGFQAIAASSDDRVIVPAGYRADVLYAWGDATGIAPVEFRWDASNTAAEQALQAGMHHDGIHFFAQNGSTSGLLVMNHEYVDDGLLHHDGMKTWTAQKVRKAQAAHGVAVIEVGERNGRWEIVRPSPWARRITAYTPMRFGGPAAGHALLRTAADPQGVIVLGTFNNCASGCPSSTNVRI